LVVEIGERQGRQSYFREEGAERALAGEKDKLTTNAVSARPLDEITIFASCGFPNDRHL
jgi:hypothetical protein